MRATPIQTALKTLLTVDQVAERLGVQPSTVRLYARPSRGKLRPVASLLPLRFEAHEVERFLRARKPVGRPVAKNFCRSNRLTA